MTEQWTTENSEVYRQLAAVAVPARAEQIATLLMLLPFGQSDSFRVVELASGEGRLAHAILDCFPNAHLLALDFEPTMRETTANRLQPFGSRASVAAFDIHQSDWYHHLDGADCVVSSLCIHHLDGDEKQALFSAVGSRLTPRGAFLIADLIRPQRVEARRLFAATWDRAAQAQSIEQTGSPALFKLFNDEHWNWFHYPDPFDKPSPLADQLTWLRAAGLAAADCFWMNAGHAIYGGYQSASEAPSSDPLSFDAALAAARRALL